MSFFHQLQQGTPEWEAYIDHEFVRQLAEGSLPKACFQHYLQQDYVFLMQFTRAWALALYKSRTLEEMRDAQAGINAMLDLEIGLHIDYCQQWGINQAALAKVEESPACVAYTRYVLDCGMTGELADLYAALLPCIYGYAEIGQRLSHLASVDSTSEEADALEGDKTRQTKSVPQAVATTHEVSKGKSANAAAKATYPESGAEKQLFRTSTPQIDREPEYQVKADSTTDLASESEQASASGALSQAHPYQAWINMYASEEYQATATAAKTKFNWLCKEVSASKLEQLQQIFRTATRMEVAFWQMGLDLS